jgi:MSHA biogenesis protein MshI
VGAQGDETLFGFLQKKKDASQLAAVGLEARGVCVALVRREDGRRPRLERWAFEPAEGEEQRRQVLAGLARDFDLKRRRCTTVLEEGDYKLIVTEAPDVRPEELKAALRWRVKDLIDFHINDAVLDVFDIPGERAAGGMVREMYVVAARAPLVRSRVEQLTEAGVNLEIIDIPELALRNLAALMPEDAEGLALLSLRPASGLITITRQGLLYLSRSLTFGYEALTPSSESRAGHFESITLELQRSFDYFESHFRVPPVRHLALAPTPQPLADLAEHLRAHLSVNVMALDLQALLEADTLPPPAVQADCLTTLAAALRREEVKL